MSAGSRWPSRCAIALSTALPAGTISRIRRGFCRVAINPPGDSASSTFFPAAAPVTKRLRLRSVQIVAGHTEPVTLHVEREVAPHDAQADHTDVTSHTYAPAARAAFSTCGAGPRR